MTRAFPQWCQSKLPDSWDNRSPCFKKLLICDTWKFPTVWLMSASVSAYSNVCITVHTAVKSPTNVLFQLANKDTDHHYQMFHFSHHPSFSFLPTSQLNFFRWNSDLSGKFESWPDQATAHPPTHSHCQWTLHSYMSPSAEAPVKLFPRSSPGCSHKERWMALCLCVRGGKKWEARPPPTTPKSGLGTKVNQMYSNSTHPYFPHKKEYEMIPICAHQLLFVRLDEKLLPAHIYCCFSWFFCRACIPAWL